MDLCVQKPVHAWVIPAKTQGTLWMMTMRMMKLVNSHPMPETGHFSNSCAFLFLENLWLIQCSLRGSSLFFVKIY